MICSEKCWRIGNDFGIKKPTRQPQEGEVGLVGQRKGKLLSIEKKYMNLGSQTESNKDQYKS